MPTLSPDIQEVQVTLDSQVFLVRREIWEDGQPEYHVFEPSAHMGRHGSIIARDGQVWGQLDTRIAPFASMPYGTTRTKATDGYYCLRSQVAQEIAKLAKFEGE